MEANDALLTLRPCIPPWLLPSPPCSLPFKLKTARISEYCSNGRCIIIGPRSQYKIRSYPIHSCVCTFASHSSRSSTTPAMAKPQLASAKSPVRTSRRGTSVQMLGLPLAPGPRIYLMAYFGSIAWHILDQKRGGEGAATARGGR